METEEKNVSCLEQDENEWIYDDPDNVRYDDDGSDVDGDGQVELSKKDKADLQNSLNNAAELGNVLKLRKLLEEGATVNHLDDSGKSPIIYAIKYSGTKNGARKIKCLQILLKQGADPNMGRSSEGLNTYYSSLVLQNFELLELLKQHGADTHCSKKELLALMCNIFWFEKTLAKPFRKIILDLNISVDIVDLFEEIESIHPYGTDVLLRVPKTLLYFLDKGIIVSFKEFTRFRDVPPLIETGYQVESLKHLMSHKAFHWVMWCDRDPPYGDSVNPEIVFNAVKLGVPPGKFYNEIEELVSPLIHTLSFDGDDFGYVIKYMAANLYFTYDDYRTIIANADMRKRLKRQVKNSSIWRLDTLCFLTISSALMKNKDCLNRYKQVATLPLSESMKTILNFKGSLSKLGFKHWVDVRFPGGGLLCVRRVHPPDSAFVKCDKTLSNISKQESKCFCGDFRLDYPAQE